MLVKIRVYVLPHVPPYVFKVQTFYVSKYTWNKPQGHIGVHRGIHIVKNKGRGITQGTTPSTEVQDF